MSDDKNKPSYERIERSAPTGHLPSQISNDGDAGASVPTDHLPSSKPSDGGGSGDGGSNGGGSGGGDSDKK